MTILAIKDAVAHLNEVNRILQSVNVPPNNHRDLSLAKTKVDEAILWLKKHAEHLGKAHLLDECLDS